MKRWLSRFVAGTACLLLAGCGGGGSSSGTFASVSDDPGDVGTTPAGYPVIDDAAARAYAGRFEFGRIEPNSGSEAFLVQEVGGQPACSGVADPDCVSAKPYELQSIQYAQTAILEDGSHVLGKGTLIAIVDDGFRITHRELDDKNVDVYLGATSSLPVAEHGTAVASIAAGEADGTGMMGVAPEADLHLSSWDVPAGVNVLAHLAGASNDAAARGAAVQNNSWGWDSEIAAGQEEIDFDASGAATYADYIALRTGGDAADWQNLFNAYDNFQKTGVIVFANSNDKALGDASAWGALPLFEPKLAEAWITVSNALFSVDENTGEILGAELLSAPCGSAARFCLTADGTAYAASGAGDADYLVGTGTSFAAPQVSGEIALLAQAFPNLSPREWTARLLATANRDWADFQSTIAGQQTFAPGVARPYSSLYGNGVPDMKAALEPVGGLSIASGSNVFTAERASLDAGIATSGPVVGNSIAKAISDRRVMAIDALGTDFYISGSMLGDAASGAPSALAEHLADNVERMAASFAFTETESPASAALQDAAVPKLFFSQALANLRGRMAFSQALPMSDGGLLQFAGSIRETSEGDDASFVLSRLAARGHLTMELSLSFGESASGFFGTDANGPFMDTESTGNVAAGIGLSRSLTKAWSVGAYAEFGSGFVGEDPAALVDYGAFAYASGGLTARRRGVLTGNDVLDFYAGVRPAAVAGEADVHLPVGRDVDGTIRYDHFSVDLASSDLPMRLGFVYRNHSEQDFDLLFGFNADFMAGSDPEPVYSVALGLKKAF